MENAEKRQRYHNWIARLRTDKIAETVKKLKTFGYADEDDYNYLVPPEDYSFTPRATHENGDFHGYSVWAENYEKMIESFPSVSVPYSSMAGNYFRILHRYRKLRYHPDLDFSPYKESIDTYAIDHCLGQVHHFCGDVRIGLELGFGGLLDKVRAFAKINHESAEQAEFYAAEERLVRTIIGWIQRTAKDIDLKIDQTSDPDEIENLREMQRVNERIALSPPETLREACQFMSWYNVAGRCYNREGCGGQLDELLRTYYERDTARGIIDDDDAVFYIAGLLMSDTKYYQLGGPDDNGNDMVSRVSWLVLEAADLLDVTANLTVRVHDGIDREFFTRAVELLFIHKNAWPRFSGDQSLVSGFVKAGFTEKLARNRIAVGCNWMAIPGIEFGLNDSIKVNFAKIMEVALRDLRGSGPCSTEMLWERFRIHLDRALDTVYRTTELHLATARYNSPELFLNLFTYGPIEKGTDASNFALDYYNIAVDGSGIAVAADSFAALQKRIEQEKRLNWEEVFAALEEDYSSDRGKVVQQILKTAEKFGQSKSLGERWAVRISRYFSEQVIQHRSDNNVRFIPGLFSWSKTLEFGKKVGATPDGRNAG